jgi:hypothetical protein
MEKKMTLITKIELFISHFLRLTLFIAVFSPIFTHNWQHGFLSLFALFLCQLPSALEKNYRIHLPIELEIIFVGFIYASIFLGEVGDFYERFLWWDIMLHMFSGIVLGLTGFIMLFVLSTRDKIQAAPSLTALFAFCFSIAVGALWEVFEYAMDQFFDMSMQKSGLIDTMSDLIVNFMGAACMSFFGYLYLKYNKKSFFTSLMEAFTKSNPRLFKHLRN